MEIPAALRRQILVDEQDHQIDLASALGEEVPMSEDERTASEDSAAAIYPHQHL